MKHEFAGIGPLSFAENHGLFLVRGRRREICQSEVNCKFAREAKILSRRAVESFEVIMMSATAKLGCTKS